MRRRTALVSAASFFGAMLGQAAGACSVVSDYKVPTNLELAAKADTIVLATVSGERRAENPRNNVVVTAPSLVMKGTKLPAVVEIEGAYLANDDASNRLVVASEPRELRAPNPGALIGGCVRYIFRPGMQLVLFLARDKDGKLSPIRSTFARDAEDVTGADALWVKAIREYAVIGAAPRTAWKERLRARIAELEARTGDQDAQAIAQDMKVELTGRRIRNLD